MSTKIALVTGANKGIGLETARQLAAQGITVLLGARDKAKGEAAAKKIGSNAKSIVLDVTNPAHHKAVRERIEKEFGHLDILVNNAGVAPETHALVGEASVETVKEIFETNLFATVTLTQTLLLLLKKSNAGRIVNVSSRLGSLSVNATLPEDAWYNDLGYNGSKAAMNMFTILLAKELKRFGIKVNSAHPGWVRTDMGGPKAPLDAVEGAKTSVWLATLPDDGPTGGFFHQQEQLPW